jgi:hypothetical protein
MAMEQGQFGRETIRLRFPKMVPLAPFEDRRVRERLRLNTNERARAHRHYIRNKEDNRGFGIAT